MQLSTRKIVDAQLKEALISMTTLAYIEENALLTQDQLRDAKKSLQALFLRTSGEETMLRKLIAILKTTKTINQAFSNISKILAGISRSGETLQGKLDTLRVKLERMHVTAEENSEFVGPFLSFSTDFIENVRELHQGMKEYIDTREKEAQCSNVYRIAHEARSRLRDRLSGTLGAQARGEVEEKIKQEVFQTFDYGEAEKRFKEAKRKSRRVEVAINETLGALKEMCQMAMNPDMRERLSAETTIIEPRYEDVFTLSRAALKTYPRLREVKQNILDLFKLYQHSYGMFRLDFENLNRAIQPMLADADAYFKSKEEDEDIRVKREKLQKIEVLIPFVENTAEALTDKETATYAKFSKRFSEIISEKKMPWEYISGDLLRMKVMAEAELSARM
jgi:cell division protein FtsB